MRIPALLLLAALGLAADPLPGVLQRAQAAAERVPTLRLTFTQTKHLAILDEPLIATGSLEMDRGQTALRWQFDGQALLILAHGRLRRWGREGREEDLGRDPGIQALVQPLEGLLTGSWDGVQRLFRMEEVDGGDTVRLVPRGPGIGRFLDNMTITFGDTGAPVALLLVTADGDRTDYRFAAPDTTWKPAPDRFSGP